MVRISGQVSPQLLGGDTQVIYNIEYRVPIVSVLTLAAFADVGTAFNARKYNDQITSSNFVGNQRLGSVILDPEGKSVTDTLGIRRRSG